MISELYHKLSLFKQSRAYVDFLTQYNASVDSDLKFLFYMQKYQEFKNDI